jgi:hypothetical protein
VELGTCAGVLSIESPEVVELEESPRSPSPPGLLQLLLFQESVFILFGLLEVTE